MRVLPSTWAAAKHEDYTEEGDTALPSAFDGVFTVFQVDAREGQVTELTEINLQAFCRKIGFCKTDLSPFLRSDSVALLFLYGNITSCDIREAAERGRASSTSSW